MLCVAPKGQVSPAIGLSSSEDRLLRQAFGRYCDPSQRAAAADVVRRWQLDGPGHWILCDCLGASGEDGRMPALIPVAEAHLRRHVYGDWPAHALDCDFFKDAVEQRVVTRSYRPSNQVDPVVRGFGADPLPWRVHLSGTSYAEDRPPLARLLMRVIHEAGLDKVTPGWTERDLAGQYRMIRRAARAVPLTGTLRLGRYLETFAPDYESFRGRIEAIPVGTFKPSRPHGIMICVARAISAGMVEVGDNLHLAVQGRISVFGETEGHGRIQDADARRPPYLVAALVARPSPDAPAAILRAYAHPVASRAHLLLVDSNHERRTLERLMKLQRWLLKARNVLATIEKPLFDLGAPDDDDWSPVLVDQAGGGNRESGTRPPIIPDFVMRAKSAKGGLATVIVETMGYEDERYVERKARIHPLMRAALGEAPIVLHHCHHRLGNPDEVDGEMGRQVLRLIFQQIEPKVRNRSWHRTGTSPGGNS